MQDVHLKYNSFNQLMKTKFGSKVYRITLNSGLSCPNIDGTRAKGGCYFCNDDYLLAKSWHKQQPIEDQLSYGIEYVKERHPNTHQFLAYFQNGTNTHAKADFLRPLFYKSIEPKEIVGLMISTRPDCLDNEILDLLSELNEKTYLWVELGLQSPQNHILEKINRAHTVEEFAAATEALHSRGILNCAHIILGMPDETPEEMIQGVDFINNLPVDGIKIHNMFVTEFTAMAKWYREGKYKALTLDEYAKLCVDYLERMRPDIVVHRLNAHAPARLTVAPEWSINKLGTLNAIHAEIVKRNTMQGKLYKGRNK
jgi:uncharacterized protein